MRQNVVGCFKCLSCRSDLLNLEVKEQKDDGVIDDGVLRCGKCEASYRIVRGIPRFVPESNYADSFGYQWNIHGKTQLDSYSGLKISRDRVFGVTGWGTDLQGQCILEAGSGSGRFTEVLLGTGAEVVSFDYSTAVDANFINNGKSKRLTLFQGDIFNIPLKQAQFDKVFCFGVLQHTPDPEMAFYSLARYVRPGGSIAVDIYRKDFKALMQWKYLLRPITKKMNKQKLYVLIEKITPILIPVARVLRKIAGRAGARLLPIVEFSHLGLNPDLNLQWAILESFDMYSPMHDHPNTIKNVSRWLTKAGFIEVNVRNGPNGVVATGKLPN